MAHCDDVRLGVFLLPDARTSATVTMVTGCLRAQYGLVSAARFPPHITLAGSLPLAVGEAELLAAVREVAARHRPILLANAGPRQLWSSVVAFDVHADAQGLPNEALVDLAADVTDVVQPLLRTVDHLAPDVRGRDDWHAHISLASHEMRDRPELGDVVVQFIHELDAPYPSGFSAARLAVFRFHHPDWADDWWTDFSWEFVCSWPLSAGPVSAAPA